ncbi:oligosaccharide flippase family protein [Marinomonas arenicola]|uniref:oligosaccharide flippase family protein n=1 Tax=Marinomonas arenicola TaxID=569601 RepID=UPI00311EC39A
MNLYLNNSLWILVDKVFILGGGLIVYVVVSNYLGPVAFGKVSFGVALASIPITLSQWGANHTISNMAISNRVKAIRYIIATKKIRCFLYLFISFFIFFILFYVDSYRADSYFILLIILSHFHSGLDVSQYYFSAVLESKVNAFSSMISKFISIFTRLFFVYLNVDLLWFFLPYFFNNYISYKIKYNKLPVHRYRSRRYGKSYIKLGKGFVLSAFFTIIYSKINEILLSGLFGYSEVAIFNVAMTLAFSWSFFPQAFGLSYFTKAMRGYDKKMKEDAFSFIIFLMLVISMPIVFLVCLFSSNVVSFLFSENYMQASEILPILTFSCLFSSLGLINNRIIGGYKRGSNYLYKKVISCSILSVFLSYFLIKFFGLIGAAYSLLIVEVFSVTVANYFFKSGLILKIHFRLFSFSYWLFLYRSRNDFI